MARLVVNPGSPTAWEIHLKPGANSLGRGPDNDFKIPDGSVSGSHCQILLNERGALIRDLGSTNGTFVNRAPVSEAQLQSGQTVHLGGVPMAFYTEGPEAVTLPPPPRPGVAPAPPAPRLSISSTPPRVEAEAQEPPPPFQPEPYTGSVQPLIAGKCKHHPKNVGRFFCAHCHHFFCELCVNSRNLGGVQHKFCRHCGAECTAAQVQVAAPVHQKGFFARVPGAFAYPFRGTGVLVLIVSTLLFAALSFLSRGGLLGILFGIVAGGYLFSYMQNIIHSTAAEDEQMPDLPGWDGIFGAFFRFAIIVIICFGPPIALGIMKIFFDMEDIPMSAILATTALGCLYFPMAFLAVAMKDSVFAANPLIVMPAIFKAPGQYLVTALVVLSVFGARQLGDYLMIGIRQGIDTHDMSTLLMGFGIRAFWSLASLYLLTVSMRILGTLYVINKRAFGWFNH